MVELRENGVSELVERMERSIGVKVTVTHNGSAGTNGGTSPFQHLQSRFQNTLLKFTSAFERQAEEGQLPQRNGTLGVSAPSLTSTSATQQRMLHLLACMRIGRFRKSLSQDRVETVISDRELFLFLRENFTRHRGRLRRFFTLNGVQNIFFVKLRLPSSEFHLFTSALRTLISLY